jgi:hypothetical protein
MKSYSITFSVQPSLAIVATLLLGCGLASADPEAATPPATPPPKPAPKWETTAAAGVTLTSGNSKTLLVTLGLDTKRKTDYDEAAFGISGGYGENNSVKSAQFLQGFGQYNKNLSPRWYVGLRLDGAYDGIAELDYRITITPLAGYYLVKETNTTFVLEAGPSGVFEKHQNESENSYAGLRLSERLEHKLSATSKIWENVSYVPNVSDWIGQYVVTAEAGIDTTISKGWTLRLVMQDIYDSKPTPGRQSNDFRLIAGTAYKF